MQTLPSYLVLPAEISSYERLLVRLDDFPVGTLARVVIGFAVVPSWLLVTGAETSGWSLLPWFVAILMTVRVLTVILRKLMRFPEGAEAIWQYRRWLAKRFDSYQWRKLLPFGLGMVAHHAIAPRFEPWVLALTLVSIVAGLAGQWSWRIHRKSWPVTPR